MTDRTCHDCVFIEKSTTGAMFKCGCPVPYWIEYMQSPFVHSAYAKNCLTYKARVDVIKQVVSEAK